jgi:stearoyl-CoA desaturase (delta-9 desaturase)
MKIYSVSGYVLILLHVLAGGLTSPTEWGFLTGAVVALLYLLFVWFLAGVYLTDVIHMGVAHRALDFNPGFTKFVSVLFNTVGIYINPTTWVNRHRHHHSFSDQPGDPNKLAEDGFWKTMYLCLFPYKCGSNLANDAILKSWSMRLISTPAYAIFSQFFSYAVVWLLAGNWQYALSLWLGVRIIALWVNMIQNYWSHDRRFGARKYPNDGDNAMNLCEWLPVTATFSACLQNNHHHYPSFLRTSHDAEQYDFGLITVRWLKKLGVVQPSRSGLRLPQGVTLSEAGL